MSENPSTAPDEKTSSKAGKALTAVLSVLLVLLIAVVVFNFWFVNNYFALHVDGESMCDTLQDEDWLYVKKTNLKPQRGDIVIVDVSKEEYKGYFSDNTKRVIKRLIAIEGDCIKCEGGVVYLKKAGGEYEPLDEPYIIKETTISEFFEFSEVLLGEGEIFVLGDNRPVSRDSRFVYKNYKSCLKYTDIVGVVPEWAVKLKSFTTKWEGWRSKLFNKEET